MTNRTIAIGDIHGCASALISILDTIKPAPSDTLIQLGDVIDRGPDTPAAIERMIALSKSCRLIFIRGNHEELLLDAVEDSRKLPRWLRNGGIDTLHAYRCNEAKDLPVEHREFLRSSIDYFETDRHIFVHAGYVEDEPMTDQSSLALRWRITNENCRPHCSGKTVIAGHTAQKSGEVLDLGYVKCIDTNCVRGGWLTAIDVDTGQTWQSDQHGFLRRV